MGTGISLRPSLYRLLRISTCFIMAHIIMGKDKDEALAALQDFACVYARGLMPRLMH